MYISNDVKYVGVNDKKIDLFEGQYAVPLGISYNSYVIIDKKIAVVDSVGEGFGGEWLDNIKNALGNREPDYLVVQHMEPDHSASITLFTEEYPNAKILASQKAFAMMRQFFGVDFSDKAIVVSEGNTLSLGTHTLRFITAPMVHWPEVIMTYDEHEKTIFSADAFGKFGALDTEDEWACEARRYYIGIVGKYGIQVQAVLPQKLLGTGILRIAEELGRRGVLGNDAAVHKEDAVGNLASEAHFVCNDDHCHTLVCEFFDQVKNLTNHFGVESRGGLIKEHHLRIHCKRAHDGDTLLLSARKGRGIDVCLFFQPDTAEKGERFFFFLGADLLFGGRGSKESACFFDAQMHGSKHDVFDNGLVIKKVELLEHHTDVFAVLVDVNLHIGKVLTAKEDRAARGVFHTVQAAQKGAFAASRRTDNGNLFAFVNILVDAFEDFEVAKAFAKTAHLE